MDRELLLLGLLRMHDMHGYQINEFMDAHLGTSVQVKRPTVYKLLGNMVEEGWITYQEEREGNYPTRRVYQITPEGEEAFKRLLRESLADYRPVSHLGSIGFMYLDALPSKEVVPLLTAAPRAGGEPRRADRCGYRSPRRFSDHAFLPTPPSARGVGVDRRADLTIPEAFERRRRRSTRDNRCIEATAAELGNHVRRLRVSQP